ncbi:MAG TPA: RNA polymerase factor sigma-54 [Xanthomonadaceae bacterium]|nr:RNA polymerase factor sigma-54 [Xanthomonadaceae bacterium]
MKPSLQVVLGQQLRLTPQLRQAIHLLQLSGAELEQEIADAVESNPLLDWDETSPQEQQPDAAGADGSHDPQAAGDDRGVEWEGGAAGPAHGGDADAARDNTAAGETLHDHLLWQLHLGTFSPRDRAIGAALVDAIDDDGYLREALPVIAAASGLQPPPPLEEVSTMLHQLQCFDPPGIGARDLGECLRLQLALLPDDTPGKALAADIAGDALERLPRAGIEGLARELRRDPGDVATAVALLRGLDPRPGARFGDLPEGTYIAPDVVVWRDRGVWRVALAPGARPRVVIHQAYAALANDSAGADASYLRGRLQEARWLLKGLQARGDTLLKVMRCVLREQSGFLEFGEQALRPLTLREVAGEVGLHESTVSRAVARKYARTPRGTLPLRAFFASGIDTGGGEASSTAVQALIRQLVDAEDPRRPLSDARLADALKAAGIPVARRTVAKYREALRIPVSADRVRMA